MANITFEDYFTTRGQLIGPQPTEGDEALFLRADTVYRGSFVYNKAFANLSNNSTETVINTIDVWEPIGGTMASVASTPTFTFATNQYTYVGPDQIEPTAISVHGNLSTPATGATKYEIGLFVNDVLVGSGIQASLIDTAGIVPISAKVIFTLTTGDVIDFRIRNRTNTENAIVVDAHLVISQ